MSTECLEIDSRAFGLACGILWSVAVAFLGFTARFGWGERWERLLADFYRGYNDTVGGAIIGGLWAFVDGFTGGYLLARLYNGLRT